MDSLLFLLAGGLLLSWIVGVVGFFRAGRALREVAALRTVLAARRAEEPADVTAVPAARPVVSVPQMAPEMVFQEERASVPPPPDAQKVDFEAVLTQRWGIWLGGAALLLSGVFLIRYVAERGLLGPAGRCAVAALLGAALLAAAEYLLRRPPPELLGRFKADQSPPALAAGGCGILFGAAYGVASFYALVPPSIGFALMAAAAGVALLASLRFGQLTAAIGILAAFATPALVKVDVPSLPGLFGYLFALSAAALALMRWTAWSWLGWGTAIAGAAWVGLTALTGKRLDDWAPALFVPAVSLLNLLLLPGAALEWKIGRRMAWLPMAALGAAGLFLEMMADGAAVRAGIFLLSPVAVGKAMLEPRLVRMPWLAAGYGLLAMLFWALPAWHPTGEAITIEGAVQGFLPGAWAPEVIVPLLTAAGLFAGFHAVSGLVLERRAGNPLVWASLPAGVPVLALGVAYAQMARFQSDSAWALAALALAAALVFAAHLAMREGSLGRAGVHGAGAAAALALTCAILFTDQWLTLSIALFVPALAWIEGRTGVRGLRHVALAVVAVVMLRLLPNWCVLDYALGRMPVVNGLAVAYALPAVAFAGASVLFRRAADDLLVSMLEAAAILLLAAFVALEVRHTATGGAMMASGSFTEWAFHLMFIALQAAAFRFMAARTGRWIFGWSWRIEGTVAYALGVILLVTNPALSNLPAGTVALAAAYLVPGALAALAAPYVPQRRQLGIYAVIAGFVWIGLQIRTLFHDGPLGLERHGVRDAELWAWSGAWLAYGIAVMAIGIVRGQRDIRRAALAIIGLVAAKAFLWDMAGLDGLWRAASFLGLGLTLIGLGWAYRRFVLPARQTT